MIVAPLFYISEEAMQKINERLQKDHITELTLQKKKEEKKKERKIKQKKKEIDSILTSLEYMSADEIGFAELSVGPILNSVLISTFFFSN